MKQHIINERIRAREVRLIDDEGGQVGIIPIEQARTMSEDRGLDLVLISPSATPPVCKLVDYGQFRYEQRKKEKQARKTSKGQVLKELKLTPKMSDNDYNVRVNAGKKFLKKGYSVKLSVFFRGREMTHPELGRAMIDRYLEDIQDDGQAATHVQKAARSMLVLINPKT